MKKRETYNFSKNISDDILEITVTGDNTLPDTHAMMIKEIIDIDKSTNLRKQLVDIRELKGRFGITNIYNLVRDYPPERPRMMIALVDIPEYAETASFHETTAYNAGLTLKWFTDINEARAWLKGK